MTAERSLTWPSLPDVAEPAPQGTRRSWGKVSYEERYRRQRHDLLQATARLAARDGYQGTRIADIVAEAGLSKGTFYEHFSSKEDCFLELYRRTNAGMLRAGITAAEAHFGEGAHETVLAVIRALTAYVDKDPRLARALDSEPTAHHPAIVAERARNRRRVIDLFVVLAERLGSPLDADELRLGATILVEGVIAVMPEFRRDDLDAQLHAVARVGCRGLGLASA